MADIKVNLWKSAKKIFGNFGHLSLELSDGLYISFWPTGEKALKKPGYGKTYEKDVADEGGPPNEILLLPPDIVDQAKIKDWWKEAQNRHYNVVSCNCATVVREALMKGGIVEGPDVVNRFKDEVTPAGVFAWAKDCKNFAIPPA